MDSRYQYMKASSVRDINQNNFPDPLSINYNNISLSKKPEILYIEESDIKYFWMVSNKIYGAPELEDVALSLNGYSHKNFLEEGDPVIFPDKEDIKASFGG